MKKSKLQSKTLWTNGLALLASLAMAFGLDLGLTGAVQAEIVVGIMAVVNIGLRFVTSQELK